MRVTRYRKVRTFIMLKAISILFLLLTLSAAAAAQNGAEKAEKSISPVARHVASSAAYAEVLLDRTERIAELESLLADYTEEFPRIKELRYSLELIEREIARLSNVKPADAGRLTTALGKLIVQKVELDVDVWKLSATFKDEHPDLKRAKRRSAVYEAAIKEILG